MCIRLHTTAVVALAVGLGWASAASAQSTPTISGLANGAYGYTQDQNSAAITSPDVARASLNATAGKIASRLASFNKKFGDGSVAPQQGVLNWNSDETNGVSGGTGKNPYGAWASLSYTSLGDDNEPTRYDGDLYNGVMGIDYNLDRYNMIFGAAAVVEQFSAETPFNDGGQDHFGIGISPYFAWRFFEYFSVSAIAGYQRTVGSGSRKDFLNAGGGVLPRDIEENYDSDRYFGAVNLNANYIWRFLSVDFRAGAQWMQEWLQIDMMQDGDDGSGRSGMNNRLGQAIVEIKPGMFFKIDRGSYVKPYILAQYQWDFVSLEKKSTASGICMGEITCPQDPHANDTQGLLFGAGLDIFSARGFSFNLEYTEMFLREDEDQSTITGYFRMDF